MGRYDEVMKRTEWFREARFGLFMHYGIYSVNGTNEWCKHKDSISEEQYDKYFENFTAENFDAKAIARLAKEAGMKYAVLTAKHHDGFCLFDSALTDYKATNTPAKRDLIREYADAFRAEGLRVGFYYSLLDWHHPDYPQKGDWYHPRRNDEGVTNEGRDFSRYIEYFHGQVRELLTNYGKIDLMWFDFSYGEMRDEKWEATKLIKMVRSLQPDIIIDDRLTCPESRISKDIDLQPCYSGDYISPERWVPHQVLLDEKGRIQPWEICDTTQDGAWGYNASEREFSGAREIIFNLVECVSKGGNLLLNVGPTAKGEFPEPIVKTLKEVGEWMRHNGESIYGCGATGLPRLMGGTTTGKEGVIYAHIFDRAGCCVGIEGVKKSEVDFALCLDDCSEVKLTNFWGAGVYGETLTLPFLKIKLKNPLDTVVKIILKKDTK